MHLRSRSRRYREGWSAALKTVSRGLVELRKEVTFSVQAERALEVVDSMLTGMASATKRRVESNRSLARRYGVSLRTVTNWRREGCPFHESPRKVLAWISRRRYAPKGTEARFKDRLSTQRIRSGLAEIKAGFAQVRMVKELHKIYGVEPDAWLKRFRCPKKQRIRSAKIC